MDFQEQQDAPALESAVAPSDGSVDQPEASQADKALVQKILKTIKADIKHHEKAYTRMHRDMFIATHGREETYSEKKYKANLAGRHVRQKTATLYAKNPKAVANRRETLDFVVWDESQQSLLLAMQTVQQAAQMMAAASAALPTIDVVTGQPVPAQPQPPPGFAEAQALIADFQQGMKRRQGIKKFGRTLEVLFAQALRREEPLDFKTALKAVVRRACTTGVGYVETGFQREMGPRPGMADALADSRTRLDHLQNLMEQASEEEISEIDAEMAELQASVASLQQEPEIVLRAGLVFDFPLSTHVIPDKLTTSLVGWIGARHLAIRYLYTPDEVKEIFKVDIGNKYTPYSAEGKAGNGVSANTVDETQGDLFASESTKKGGLCCVYKYFDKPSGLVHFVLDGYDCPLRMPAAPDVFVVNFFPIDALTFNAVENEKEVFPPSDVTLLLDQQRDLNASRQGKREHRKAARPRWAYTNGALDDEDVAMLQEAEAFDAISLNKDPAAKLSEVLEVIPVPGVDPNLYDTGEIEQDAQLVVGASQASVGGIAKATATESAISAGATSASDGSSVDDLDAFLTRIARKASQILMKEMTQEQVMQLCGPGAVWPAQNSASLSEEMYLEIEAGSSGKPNQAVEMANWEKMLPFLIQMGSIPPAWLARETLRRLDDRMDLTEAVVDGIPSIVAQNAQAQPAAANAAQDPKAQGGNGAQNGPAPPGGPTGSGPAFGSNQV